MYVSRGNYVIRGTLHREATARWENRISTLTFTIRTSVVCFLTIQTASESASGLG